VTFASPWLLLGLALIPLLVIGYGFTERGRRRASAGFAAPATVASVVPRRPGWRRHAPPALAAFALAVLIVALARPQVSSAVPAEQASIVLAMDHSGSMQATDVAPTRLAAAKKAAATFLDAIPEKVRVGAVAFNQKAEVLQSPTRDHDAVKEAIESIQPAGSTATGDAIDAALSDITGKAPAAIVLLSDGKSVRGSDPLEAAQKAKQRKIPIYTVALGTAGGTINDGEPVPPDPQTLAQIAQTTGGKAFTASDLKSLDQVYKRLGSQVATEKRPLEVTNLFAGGALGLMVLSAFGSIRWFGRLL
jgi:Ca-activated chloride channel homolog